jgi:mono/diheme cytochrome c family protein
MALFTLTLALALLLAALTVSGPAYAADEGGKAVFTSSKCGTCHGVSSAGLEAKLKGRMAGPDLTGVVEDRGADVVKAYLQGDEQIEGKKHKMPFKGSDEELAALIDWLAEQKAQ